MDQKFDIDAFVADSNKRIEEINDLIKKTKELTSEFKKSTNEYFGLMYRSYHITRNNSRRIDERISAYAGFIAMLIPIYMFPVKPHCRYKWHMTPKINRS